MNMLKKGPEIKFSKLSEVKVPGPLRDLYHDLNDRHLLPLVAVLLVAIIATPILLSSETSPVIVPEAGARASAAPASSPFVVTKTESGLRDYESRFDHLTPTDPFRPQSSGGGGSEGEGGSETSSSGSSEESSSSSEESAPTGEEPSGGSASTPVETHTVTYFTYAIDVRVTPVHEGDNKGAKKAEPTVRRNLPPLTMLPSRETPAFTYMGPTKDGKKAVMLVSDNVTGLFGDATCVVGGEACQLLALEPGIPESVAWGTAGRTFKIELIKIYVQRTDKLNRAPLGKPKSHKGNAAAGRTSERSGGTMTPLPVGG